MPLLAMKLIKDIHSSSEPIELPSADDIKKALLTGS
eukprot:CAMPEP_0206364612 /NCGR_PEP_ID=MMETSP0294-20121207/2326_1 /ASSEMBLY_ACC=CAM_ASM_000327 /TAXON_ID=39354 /ORGANISM="Heterosigma akashiwo, Strain CCMP2393" /LENGTH=35 /DNA_ID= /DNA_START= /DNA_END= /DNA_ORIENTATION=